MGNFFYANIDRIAVLSIWDMKELGLYQSVIGISGLMETLTVILVPSLIPTFSNLIIGKRDTVFRQAFIKLSHWCVIPITIMNLTVMAFSREILCVFGHEYTQYSDILILFCLVSIIRSLRIPSLIILTCKEKNTFRFLQPLLMILVQFCLTFIFMYDYGMTAIIGAKLLCVSISSFVGVIYVFFFVESISKIPLSYKSALVTGVGMMILRIWFVPADWRLSVLLLLSSIMLFLMIARFNLKDIDNIRRFIMHKDGKVFSERQQGD